MPELTRQQLLVALALAMASMQQTVVAAATSSPPPPLEVLAGYLGDEVGLALEQASAAGAVSAAELRGAAQLVTQAAKGIDYATLGQGWDHPTTRLAYRDATHASFTRRESAQRSQRSVDRLRKAIGDAAAAAATSAATHTGEPGPGPGVLGRTLCAEFLVEIGQAPPYPPRSDPNPNHTSPVEGTTGHACDVGGVLAALDEELLLPLRSLNEAQRSMHRTFHGGAVPAEPVAKVVAALTRAVVGAPRGGFSAWRYGNPVGRRQLEGLTPRQAELWAEPFRMVHRAAPLGGGGGGTGTGTALGEAATGAVVTHEGGPDELGLFWATKVGGPSHGFDVEGQCVLPLLANARHKAVLLEDKAQWPHHPAGRAHFRLLWSHEPVPRALLWLETVNVDFAAARSVDPRRWEAAVVAHAVAKARHMGVALSVAPDMARALQRAVEATEEEIEEGGGGGGGGGGDHGEDKGERAGPGGGGGGGGGNKGSGGSGGSGGRVIQGRGRVYVDSKTRMVLRPSNAVVEASDYLTEKHDWVQLHDEVVGPFRRAVYEPPPPPPPPPPSGHRVGTAAAAAAATSATDSASSLQGGTPGRRSRGGEL